MNKNVNKVRCSYRVKQMHGQTWYQTQGGGWWWSLKAEIHCEHMLDTMCEVQWWETCNRKCLTGENAFAKVDIKWKYSAVACWVCKLKAWGKWGLKNTRCVWQHLVAERSGVCVTEQFKAILIRAVHLVPCLAPLYHNTTYLCIFYNYDD